MIFDSISGVKFAMSLLRDTAGDENRTQPELTQELRLRRIITLAEANRFLRESYIAEFNRRFSVQHERL